MTTFEEDIPGSLANDLGAAGLVAWDIETSGLSWQTDRIGTCQLFAEGFPPAVVQVGLRRPERLMGLLADPNVEKVLHHAPFDLRFMISQWKVSPASISCTKVASKILEPSVGNEQHSLQALLRENFSVDILKGAIRVSDWTANALSDDQLEYAVTDVIYLPALLRVLRQRLVTAGLADLYARCCEFLPSRVFLEIGGYPDVFSY